MTFVVHRAERIDVLSDVLADILLEPVSDPFAEEVVAVHSRGVERWLAHRMATRLGATPGRSDGVCANLRFPFPGRLVEALLASATGQDAATDPWQPERLTWPLLNVVEANLHQPWLSILAGHLGAGGTNSDEAKRDRRFGAVRHLADLFDRYGVHRPSMILAWAAGDDCDAGGAKLEADAQWQAELWRQLRQTVGVPSPAERSRAGCEALIRDPSLTDLPGRICLFGFTRLPSSYLDVLEAVAHHRDVHLLALLPSPGGWGVEDRTNLHHPLLRAWGRDSHELQLVLNRRLASRPVNSVLHHRLPQSEPTTLLQQIQTAVRNNTPPPLPADRPRLDPDDTSIQIHACHGRGRQAEVVRDAVTHLFAADSTLEPRHVVIMCPDIDEFAPLLRAAFDDDDDAPRAIPYRLADRSLRQTNPILGAVAELLALADARLTASQVLNFAALPPVRFRFGFDDDDLKRMADWIAATGICWGLDADHRADYGLGAVGGGTWDRGLQRLLLGITMAEDDLRLLGTVLPLDDVDSGDIDLVGRFVEFVDRLGGALRSLNRVQSLAEWVTAINAAADLLFDTTVGDSWERTQLDHLMADVATQGGPWGGLSAAVADGTAPPVALRLSELRDVLADRLKGQPTRAAFRTGDLTMCTLVPMRSVPHRVICLVGLDDGVFPRGGAADGDDLILRDRRPGDHDRRSEDRQLLLDALLAAGESLIITYSGRDEHTNAVLAPAVPVNELLEVVDTTVLGPEGVQARPRDSIVHHHPLAPTSPGYFEGGVLGIEGPWSFDERFLAGARSAIGPQWPAQPFISQPLPPLCETVVSLDSLRAFVAHPARAFLRQRLGLSLRTDDDRPNDAMIVDLNGLASWGVGQRFLTALLAGADADAIGEAETARGTLPPGEPGRRAIQDARAKAEAIATLALATADGSRGSLGIGVDLGSGRQLVGVVADVVGDTIRPTTFSRLGPRQMLSLWVDFLTATVAHPRRKLSAVVIGGRRATAAAFGFEPMDPAAAAEHLFDVVALRDEGLCRPLPLYCQTSYALAAALRSGSPDPFDDARAVWTSDFHYPKEDADAEHRLILGGQVALETIAGDHEFEALARRLWDPLLDAARGNP